MDAANNFFLRKSTILIIVSAINYEILASRVALTVITHAESCQQQMARILFDWKTPHTPIFPKSGGYRPYEQMFRKAKEPIKK